MEQTNNHYVVQSGDTIFYRRDDGVIRTMSFNQDNSITISSFNHCPRCGGSATEMNETDMTLDDCSFCDNKITQ